jgi:hypothetical protein
VIALNFLQVLDLFVGHILLKGVHLDLLDCIKKIVSGFRAGSPYSCESALSEYLLKVVKGGDVLDLLDRTLGFAHYFYYYLLDIDCNNY